MHKLRYAAVGLLVGLVAGAGPATALELGDVIVAPETKVCEDLTVGDLLNARLVELDDLLGVGGSDG